jgi:hypothetical protein
MSSFPNPQRCWSRMLQTVQGASRSFSIFLFCLSIAQIQKTSAIVDANSNGVSDLWEKKYNSGNLFPATFDPLADLDGDGWKNFDEATAGTNPFMANPPTGIVKVNLRHIPAVYSTPTNGSPLTLITAESYRAEWPTIIGKQYTLLSSTSLSTQSWTNVGYPRVGDYTNVVAIGITASLPGGASPDRLFWRVIVHDRDDDFDTLTNTEESIIGSNAYSWDSDGDSIGDAAEYNIHRSNPNSRDSDSDGVSDKDEILANFTNPTTAADTDTDGIPDDHERHLAKQFLTTSTGITPGDARHIALLAGDLDSNFDYTGDGMSAEELVDLLTRNFSLFATADPVVRQTQFKNFQFQVYDHGFGYYLGTGYGFGTVQSKFPREGINVVTEELDNAPWLPNTLGGPGYYGGSSSGYAEKAGYDANGNMFRVYGGGAYRFRHRLIASRTDHYSHFQRLIKTTSEFSANYYQHPYITYNLLQKSIQLSSISLPRGRMVSSWLDIEIPPLANGKSSTVEVAVADIDFDNIFHQTTYLPDEEQEDRGFGGYVGLSKVINGQEQTPLAEVWVTPGTNLPWRLQFNSGGRYKLYSAYSDHSEIVSEQLGFQRGLAIQVA